VSEAQDQATPHIVVVDDDPEMLKLIVMLLRRIGATVQTFEEGQPMLQYLATDVPDMIILDLMLPGIDGLEVLRQIRAQQRFNDTPILILSAKADPNTIRKGLDMGADGYVTKPYVANSLIDRVRLLLNTDRQMSSDPDSTNP
jgi:DNA-binding response OmpR family regulator